MPDMDTDDARLDIERAEHLSNDLELERITSEDEDYESAPPGYEIATYPADYTLEVLYHKWNKDEILIPEFQRRFVWKQVQSSKLIESFLLGLPVPAIFFYSERKKRKYVVIDGQQRLKSIFYYFEGYFGSETKGARRVFSLKGLNSESRYHGKTFDDLREDDRRRLENAVLRTFIVQQLDPDDDTSMYHIFERLNTGGTLLSNQEIRDCVCHGSVVEKLGRRPFHIRSGLNAAIFDAVMVVFSGHLDEIPEDVSDRYRSLVGNLDFDRNTRQRTTDVDSVRHRFDLVSQQLFGA